MEPGLIFKLVRRDYPDPDEDDDSCTGFCDDGYVRWIIAIIIIVAVISLVIVTWSFSIRRATGHWGLTRASARAAALRDTDPEGGVIRNRSRRGRRHRNRHGARVADDVDPVPVYNERPGEDDAGYYDANGTYVAYEPPPYEPPKAIVRTRDVELDNLAAEEPPENVFGHEDDHALRRAPGTI